jgi:hypothetical protein
MQARAMGLARVSGEATLTERLQRSATVRSAAILLRR